MLTILVVDDEVAFADVLSQRLRTRGMQVFTAYNGHQALDLMQAKHPDIVLLDITMPGPDGLTILQTLKEQNPITQVILLTADSTISTAVTGMKLGASDYLMKPASFDNILQAIHEAEQKRLNTLSRKRMAETAKLAALGELGKGVAHEINNPVHIMVNEVGWIEDLLEEIPMNADTDKQIRNSLQLIREQATRCKTITSKLLTLRPATNPVSDLHTLPTIWDKAVHLRANRISKTKVTLHQSWSQEFQHPLWSSTSWMQILGNLLDNALDALGLAGGDITITGQRQVNDAIVTIADTGHGIEAHLLTRIFEPFFSTKDVGQGIGLGLAICHGFVESMGGDISVRSTLGQGSVFTIKMPLPVNLIQKNTGVKILTPAKEDANE